MQVKKTKDGFHLLIEKEEKVMESLARFVAEKEIPSSTITALGAVKNARVGFYHLHKKAYDEKVFKEDHELISMVGNTTWFDGKPIVHCHVALGNDAFQVVGGHLFEAEVAVVVELFLNVKDVRVERVYNCDIGLNVQKLE